MKKIRFDIRIFPFVILFLMLLQVLWMIRELEDFSSAWFVALSNLFLIAAWFSYAYFQRIEVEEWKHLASEREHETAQLRLQIEQLEQANREADLAHQNQLTLSLKAQRLLGQTQQMDLHAGDAGTQWIALLAQTFDLAAGIVYLKENQTGSFTVQGAYAATAACLGSVMDDTGFAAEVVKSNEPMVISSLPAGYLQVESGLGATERVFLTLLPLWHGTELIGVAELATFSNQQIDRVWTEIKNELSASSDGR